VRSASDVTSALDYEAELAVIIGKGGRGITRSDALAHVWGYTTAEEIDSTRLEVKCWINGELRQHANTRDLIFDVATIIETISAGITLLPGDIIATGTPDGVGIGFDPPKFLRPGDVMKIEIDGLGTLENSIV